MSIRIRSCAVALALLAGLSACADFKPTPALKLRAGSADEIGPRLSNYGSAVLPPGGSISVWGDDFTSSAPGAPHAKRKSPTLAAALARATGLKVADNTTPGQTAEEGAARFGDADLGSLVVICYGYGDAAVNEDYAGEDLAPLPDPAAGFRTSLTAMVKLAHSRGVPVILVTEPLSAVTPSKKPTAAEKQRKALMDRLAILRSAVNAISVAERAGLVDSPTVLSVNSLTPAEKEPGTRTATTRIANAIAADIELGK
jgi:hypothetical protein